MKLGEEAIPSTGFRELGASVRSVLVDALANPGSSISEITGRTGFPQSHVSASVAKLRDLGALVTEPDPADRRRTLVQPGPGVMQRARQRTAEPIDATITAALNADGGDGGLAEVLAALDVLSRWLTPGVQAWPGSNPGPQIAGEQASDEKDEEEGEG